MKEKQKISNYKKNLLKGIAHAIRRDSFFKNGTPLRCSLMKMDGNTLYNLLLTRLEKKEDGLLNFEAYLSTNRQDIFAFKVHFNNPENLALATYEALKEHILSDNFTVMKKQLQRKKKLKLHNRKT